MIDDLEKSLGKAISVKELSNYLGIKEKSVRLYYKELGGILIGRQIKFFTKGVINAVEKRQEIYSAGQEERPATREGVSDAENGEGVGSKDEKTVRRRVEREDKHGLLD